LITKLNQSSFCFHKGGETMRSWKNNFEDKSLNITPRIIVLIAKREGLEK